MVLTQPTCIPRETEPLFHSCSLSPSPGLPGPSLLDLLFFIRMGRFAPPQPHAISSSSD